MSWRSLDEEEAQSHTRALERASYERMAALLASTDAAEVTRYLLGPFDNREVALLVRLHRMRRDLYRQAQGLTARFNPREDELTILFPSLDLPLPENWQQFTYMGMHLRLGAADETYRVIYTRREDDRAEGPAAMNLRLGVIRSQAKLGPASTPLDEREPRPLRGRSGASGCWAGLRA
jgi:hypothetical protein